MDFKLYVQNMKFRCDCFKPTVRRLANFKPKDDYECYSDGYVKCFWGLCDHQTSTHEFIIKSKGKVITNQPIRQEFVTPAAINDVILTVK